MRPTVIAALVSAGCGRIGFDSVQDDLLDAHTAEPLLDAPPGVLRLVPVADSFCRSGTFAADNYGQQSELVVKFSNGINFSREAFVKFDLTGITRPVSLARLALGIAADQTAGTATFDVTRVADGWSETGLTWATRPAVDAVLATQTPGPGVPAIDVDITSAVRGELAGDGVLSLRVRSTVDVGASGYVALYARESPHPPTLTITCVNGPC